MRRRFVIGAAPLDRDQEGELREYLGSKGAWWHWIENLWLLTTTRETSLDAAEIREFINNLNPTARIVVFEFPEDITWASKGANQKGLKMSDWLKEPWGDND